MPDLSRARKDIGALIGDITAAEQAGDREAALAYCLAALALAPEHIKLCCHAAFLLMEDGQLPGAEQLLREAMARRPESVSLGLGLSHVLAAQGRYADAITIACDLILPLSKDAAFRTSYASWLARMGEPANADHALPRSLAQLWSELNEVEEFSAQTQRPQDPPLAPDARWLRAFFDCFAEGFDERVATLNYTGPKALRAAVDRVMPGRHDLFIVDLGCGTGLAGAAFKPLARRLYGVDLSQRMLARAKRRNLYNDLVEADILEALKNLPQRADLIVASDVLIYIGALEELFAQLPERLRPGGCFAATIEKSDGDDCVLYATRRYAHSEKYIRRLAVKAGLDVLAVDAFALRSEGKTTIPGLAFVVGKKAKD